MNEKTMEKVLLIEDNEDNAFLFRTLFSLRDVEFFEANTGKKGIVLAQQIIPDLILMDIQLPDINGLEATKEIRQILGDNVAIIAVTSYAMAGDREKCMAAGCNGYIEKPINPKTFLQEIDAYFEAMFI